MQTNVIPVGSRVRDRITKFEGLVVERHDRLYGGARYIVQSEALSEGKPSDGYFFYGEQLQVLATAAQVAEEMARHASAPAEQPITART